MMLQFEILAAFLIFLASAGATRLVRAGAHKYGFISMPRQERWHKRPTALLGGIAIFTSFLAGYLLFVTKDYSNAVVVICGSAMFGVGLIDDFLHIKPQTKLVAQIVVATAAGSLGLVTHFTGNQLADLLITLLWLVGIANAMNLLDNIDGLCAGIAIIASVYRLIFCAMEGHTAGVTFALAFIVAIGGFIIYNFSPASIFMGDSGSLFIGFILGAMNIDSGHPYAKSVLSVLLFPVLVLSIPIFDTVLVSLARKFSGRPISVGGRDHSSHRLVAMGLSEPQAVLILYAMAIVSGAIALALYIYGFSYTIFFISLFVTGMVLFGIFLAKIKVFTEQKARTIPEKDVFQIVSDIQHKTFIALVILDVFLILTAYYGAYWLRFDGPSPETGQFDVFLSSLPIVLICSISAFYIFGLYRYNWRYTGLQDLWVMIKGTTMGTTATVLSLTFAYRFSGYSRSVFIIYWGTLLMLVAATRLSFRFLTEMLRAHPEHHHKTLIYGAGDGGELLLRELRNNFAVETDVVGFLDDDIKLVRTKIHGIPVLGDLTSVEFWVRRFRISQIIVSSGKIPADRIARIQEICDRSQIRLLRAAMRLEDVKNTETRKEAAR